MIAKENVLHREGNIAGDKITMSINPGDFHHIMSVLTDLYSDPQAAVIREYSTNALDAHIEVGQKRPIEVSTPTALSQFLKVRDYGVGLSVDDIHRIYSQYGASTKRGTNEQQGMLGLGSKSALSYGAQFTITSIKDGIKIIVAVSRDENGAGHMNIVDTSGTDEADGVEVTIPAKRDNEMLKKATDLFSYWPKGTVLLNGTEPERVDGLWITDELLLVEDESNYYYGSRDQAKHKIVMGNVAYPLDLEKIGFNDRYKPPIPHGSRLVAFLPIGSIHFTPNREALHYTKVTTDACKQAIKDYQAGVLAAVQREVDACADHAEALATVVRWDNYLPASKSVTFSYKGDTMPDKYQAPKRSDGTPAFSIRTTEGTRRYGRLGGSSSTSSITASIWPKVVWVENFKPSEVSAQHKRKLNKWVDENLPEDDRVVDSYVLLTNRAQFPGGMDKFIDKKRVVDYLSVIRPISLADPNQAKQRGYRLPGSFDIFEKEKGGERKLRTQVPGADIDTKNLFWKQGNTWSCQREAAALANFYDEFVLVCLGGGRIKKFCRENPKVQESRVALQAGYDKWQKSLTEDQRIALSINDEHDQARLAGLDPNRIDDPELQNAIRIAKVVKVADLVQKRSSFYGHYTPSEWDNPLDKYPLFSGYVSGRQADHTYRYMNSEYAYLTRSNA